MENSTVWWLTLKERYVSYEGDKLCGFEAELGKILQLLYDDMAKILAYGKLPENNKAPEDKVNWNDVPSMLPTIIRRILKKSQIRI